MNVCLLDATIYRIPGATHCALDATAILCTIFIGNFPIVLLCTAAGLYNQLEVINKPIPLHLIRKF